VHSCSGKRSLVFETEVFWEETYLINAVDPEILEYGMAGHMGSYKCSDGED